MSQQIIDLTLRIENNMLAPDCFPRPVYIKAMTHEKSIEMHNGTPEDPITSSYNYLSIVEHVGTHVDSYYHMRPDGATIDEMPLSLFFGKAVCLDMRSIPERGKVLTQNIEISPEAVKWLADHGSKIHGVEGPSTDIMDTKLYPSHRACRDLGLTHYEWLVNLTALIGKGEFQFYGVPLLLDKGTGSPVRAFAVVEA